MCQATPRTYAIDAQPSALIPGFDPNQDIPQVAKLVAGLPRSAPRKPAAKHEPAVHQNRDLQRPVPAKKPPQPSPAPRQEVVAHHPSLTLDDLEALQRELLNHAEAVEPRKVATAGPSPEATPPARTVAAYLVSEPQGASLLVYTKDKHGLVRHKLELSADLGHRLENHVAEDKSGFTLLMVERLYHPKTDSR
jgi:hypothetical protein